MKKSVCFWYDKESITFFLQIGLDVSILIKLLLSKVVAELFILSGLKRLAVYTGWKA